MRNIPGALTAGPLLAGSACVCLPASVLTFGTYLFGPFDVPFDLTGLKFAGVSNVDGFKRKKWQKNGQKKKESTGYRPGGLWRVQ
jgi:hypothetical protein